MTVNVGAPPAVPASGCFSTDPESGAQVMQQTPQCMKWSEDTAAWNAAFEKPLAELDTKVNAYNAAVNEDIRHAVRCAPASVRHFSTRRIHTLTK